MQVGLVLQVRELFRAIVSVDLGSIQRLALVFGLAMSLFLVRGSGLGGWIVVFSITSRGQPQCGVLVCCLCFRKKRMVDRSLTVRLGNVAGAFNSVITGGSIGLRMGGDRVLTVLNRGNDNGAALVGVLSNVCFPSRNRVFVGNGRIIVGSPGSSFRYKVKVIRRRFGLISIFGTARGVILNIGSNGGFGLGRTRGGIHRVASGCNFRVSLGEGVCRVSISRGRAIRVVGILCENTSVLVLSRPATILAPRRASGLFSILHGVHTSNGSVVVVARGLRRILTLSSHITILHGNRCVNAIRAGSTARRSLARVVIKGGVSLGVREASPMGPTSVLVIGRVSTGGTRNQVVLSSVSFATESNRVLNVTNVTNDNRERVLRTITNLRGLRGNRVFCGARSNRAIGLHSGAPARVHRLNIELSFIPRSELNVNLINGVSVASGVVLEDCGGNRSLFMSEGGPGSLTRGVVRDLRIIAPNATAPIHGLSNNGIRGVLINERVTLGPELLVTTCPMENLSVGSSCIVCGLLGGRGTGNITMVFINRSLSILIRLYSEVLIVGSNGMANIISNHAAGGRRLNFLVAGARDGRRRW